MLAGYWFSPTSGGILVIDQQQSYPLVRTGVEPLSVRGIGVQPLSQQEIASPSQIAKKPSNTFSVWGKVIR